MTRIIKLLLILILIISLCLIASGQDKQATITNGSENVVISVSVWDEKHSFVKGLRVQDVEVLEKKKKLSVISVEQLSGPITIGVVIDMSESMGDVTEYGDGGRKYASWLPSISSSLRLLSEKGKADNDYFIVSVGDFIEVSLPSTTDSNEFEDYLDKLSTLKAKGSQGFVDGLLRAFREIEKSKKGRRLLVAISDGGDFNLGYSDRADKLRELSRKLNVPIYVIIVPTSMNANLTWQTRSFTERRIRTFTDEGGILFNTDSPQTLRQAFEFISGELENQYAVKFVADKSEELPKWRDLSVGVDTSRGKSSPNRKVTVRAPKKFYL